MGEPYHRSAHCTGTRRAVDAIIAPTLAYTAVPHGLNTCVILACPAFRFHCSIYM
jgi:hypothetical protein